MCPSIGVLTPKKITIRCQLVVPSSSSDDDLLLARHTTRVDLNSSGARICYNQELSNVRERKEKKKKKKKKELGLKSKRGETSDEKLHVSKGEKKKRMKFPRYWERFY
jgi:hypothetical protein